MFNKLFRKYNQNRKTLLTVIIFIAFFIILIQFFNNSIKESKEENAEQLSTLNNITTNQNSNYIVNNIVTNNQNSIIQGSTNSISHSITEIVNSFVTYCNNNEIEKAYNMLSQNCKSSVYPTLNDFKNNYYNQVFNKKRSAKVEKSIYGNQIYQVKYYSDLLASGYNTQDTMQDFVYITTENNESKLNINQFLYSDYTVKTATNSLVTVKILRKNTYIDYEEYQVQVTNNSESTIAISTEEIKNNVYMIDKQGVQHLSNIEEIAQQNLEVVSKASSIINIKFYRLYNAENPAKSIHFTQIVKNYENYQRGEEVEKISLSINL